MKTKIALLVAVLVATGAVAASASTRGHAATAPTRTPGVLLVGLSLPSPGFQTSPQAPKGTTVVNPSGLEIDLARDIAAKLGIKTVKFYNEANFSRVYAPGPHPWDLLFAEVTITPARAKNVDFSVPYIDANQGVMVRKGLSPLPKSIADLKNLTLCAQTGTTGADYIKTKIHPTKPALYPNTTTIMYQQVQTGRCDATVYDSPIIGAQRKLNPSAYGPIVGQIVTHEQYGAVFQKGSALRKPVNVALKALIANGTVSKLQKKWLTTDVSKLPILK